MNIFCSNLTIIAIDRVSEVSISIKLKTFKISARPRFTIKPPLTYQSNGT